MWGGLNWCIKLFFPLPLYFVSNFQLTWIWVVHKDECLHTISLQHCVIYLQETQRPSAKQIQILSSDMSVWAETNLARCRASLKGVILFSVTPICFLPRVHNMHVRRGKSDQQKGKEGGREGRWQQHGTLRPKRNVVKVTLHLQLVKLSSQ